jgi:hypothetical protein
MAPAALRERGRRERDQETEDRHSSEEDGFLATHDAPHEDKGVAAMEIPTV